MTDMNAALRGFIMVMALSTGLVILLIAIHRLISPLYRIKDRLRHESISSLYRNPLTVTDTDEELSELFLHIQQLIDDYSRHTQKSLEQTESFTQFITQARQILEQDVSAIQKQKHLFQEIRVLIDDWSKWIPGLFKHLDHIQQMSQKHAEYTEYNQNLLDQVKPALERMDDQIEFRNHLLDDLTKKIQAVLILTKRIHALTDQTKMIAFNAAIEAATTGDIGRRFNVVASDIRKLSDTVDSSNDDMGERITDMETLFFDLKNHLSQDAPQIALIKTSFQQMSQMASELSRIMKTIDQYANQWLSALNHQQNQIETLQMTYQEMQASHQHFQHTHRQLEESIQRRLDQFKHAQPSIHRNTP